MYSIVIPEIGFVWFQLIHHTCGVKSSKSSLCCITNKNGGGLPKTLTPQALQISANPGAMNPNALVLSYQGG